MLKNYMYSILDAFDEAICISNIQGVILYVNTAYESLMHIKKEEIVNKNVSYLVTSGIADMVLAPEVIQTKAPVSRVQNLDFGKRILLQGFPIIEDGEVVLVVTFLKDKTKITELREQLDVLQSFYSDRKRNLRKKPVVLHSPAIKKVYRQLTTLADTDVTVLISGPTGVGKEVFVRSLHAGSNRGLKPMIKVDCGALPENLIETELFGYAPGSFSGGQAKGKMGLIESGHGGTVFLDEVGELPLLMQTRLLRVLQDREVLRVGATVPKPIDVRFVAATNQNLPQYIENGRFRSDLYYRLKVAEIQIPPLSRRRLDILPLIRHYLEYYCKIYSRNVSFAPEAEQALIQYSWPGNVRELENFVLKTVVEAQQKTIHKKSLPVKMRKGGFPEVTFCDLHQSFEGKSLKDIMEAAEREVLSTGLKRHGNISSLAKALRTERTTISRKLKKYDLTS